MFRPLNSTLVLAASAIGLSACSQVQSIDLRLKPQHPVEQAIAQKAEAEKEAEEEARRKTPLAAALRTGAPARVVVAESNRARRNKRRTKPVVTVQPPAPAPSPFDFGHPSIDKYVDYYADRDPAIIEQALERAAPHLSAIRKILRHAKVPPEIAYLPIVESHFKASARSGVGAAGAWQFMRGTAKRYGLRIDSCIDERRDPMLATMAASQYLSELHARFNDWHLALAAYNAGEYRVQRIMRQHGVNDYWTMVELGLLPRETMQYVPKFLGAVTVVKNAAAFGFDPPDENHPGLNAAPVRVDRQISLETIAKLAGVDRDILAELNPALACKRVPLGGYDINLPHGTLRKFQARYADLGPYHRDQHPEEGLHRVRQGESPASIARRYGVSVRALMRENGIRNPRKLRVNTKLRIPDSI